MAEDSAIRQVGLVGNRIAGLSQEEVVRAFAEQNRIPVCAMIPFDREVSDSGITGIPVDEEKSAAIREVYRLADALGSGFRPDGR
jgi:CO dehydrogenase nickel-insertion accessory protein CooC1